MITAVSIALLCFVVAPCLLLRWLSVREARLQVKKRELEREQRIRVLAAQYERAQADLEQRRRRMHGGGDAPDATPNRHFDPRILVRWKGEA